MTMLIVEYLPYLAFFAAGVLVAWAGIDLLKHRRAKPAKVARESVRGLAGPVQPLRALELEQAPILTAEAEMVAAAEVAELPVSQAIAFGTSGDTARDEPVKESAAMAVASVREESVLVRRDPSVRVFDTAVAPSERTILAEGQG